MTISLEEREKRFLLEQSAFELRKQVIDTVMPLFLKANKVVLLLVGVCLLIDLPFMWLGRNGYERLVDKHVLMTLIGATAVQLGIFAATIGRHLFPDRSRAKQPNQEITTTS